MAMVAFQSDFTLLARSGDVGGASLDTVVEQLDRLRAAMWTTLAGAFSTDVVDAALRASGRLRSLFEAALQGDEVPPGAFSAAWTDEPLLQQYTDLCIARAITDELLASTCNPYNNVEPSAATPDDLYAQYVGAARAMLADPECADFVDLES